MNIVSIAMLVVAALFLAIPIWAVIQPVEFVCKEKTYMKECNGTETFDFWIGTFDDSAASGTSCVEKRLIPQPDGSFIEKTTTTIMQESIHTTRKDYDRMVNLFGFDMYKDWKNCGDTG